MHPRYDYWFRISYHNLPSVHFQRSYLRLRTKEWIQDIDRLMSRLRSIDDLTGLLISTYEEKFFLTGEDPDSAS